MCPTLQEEFTEQVNAAGGFPGPPQQKYDPYSNTFNPGWKDRPNFRYGNPQTNQPGPQAQPQNLAYRSSYPQQQQRPQVPMPGEFLENIFKDLETNTVVSAITLRSGRELKVNDEVVKEPVQNEEVEESKLEETELNQEETPRGKFPTLFEYKPIPPFTLALKESWRDEGIKGMYEIFRRCEVNIPLLDAIKQVPRYANFLKEFCTLKRKHKLKGCQKVELGEQVSAVIQIKVPTKCKYPGMFSIPCKIGDVHLDTAMLDLEASINVMSYSVYASLNLGPLNKTEIVIQMADRSTIYPRGLLEDVLVQVNNLVFPAEFYVLDMKSNDLNSPILLGRPFLKLQSPS
ncbi:uncharacterized protein [Henckelia pumila]|uniref:uncharacterized protein n=1 Tax=Henckelia pumila TaxID=405737 RepID=UPI003C6E5A0D